MPKTSEVETPLELTTSLRDISVTERSSFRTCRRRWHLEVIKNLEPKQPSWALTFGTGIHNALEAYYTLLMNNPKATNIDAVKKARGAFAKWYGTTEKQMKKDLGPLFTDEVAQEFFDLRNLGVAMLNNYPEFEDATGVTWEKVIAVEGHGMEAFKNKRPKGYPKEADVIVHESGRCMVPIVNPITKEVLRNDEGEVVYLTARIDLLVERASPFKGLWVVDHKTTSSSPSDRGLDFDDQTTGYCYVIWRLTGKYPRGVVFNYLVKNEPKEPRYNKTAQHGSHLSTAKDQSTTPNMYREALKEEGLYKRGKVTSEKHAECLQALLDRGWDPFFKRFEPYRNAAEIDNLEARLFQEYQDMVMVFNAPEMRYPNQSTWWCPSCDMAPICQAMEDGSDVEGIIESRFQQAEDRKAA